MAIDVVVHKLVAKQEELDRWKASHAELLAALKSTHYSGEHCTYPMATFTQREAAIKKAEKLNG